MIAIAGSNCTTPMWWRAVWITGKKKGVLLKGLRVVFRTYSKDCRERELQFLDGHGLEVERKVERGHGDPRDLLPWVDKGLLDNADI